jgi:hypothetical protein
MKLFTKKKSIMKKRPSFVSARQRIVAVFTVTMMLLQICLPTVAWAASLLSNESISAAMSTQAFRKSSSNSHLYEQATFDDASHVGSQNIKTFRERLVAAKTNLGKPTFVPIGSDITIFVPTYPTGKLIGDAYVQNRYIRQQVFDLLGRHLIYASSSDTSEITQINTLYDNAFTFAKANPTLNFGANLSSTILTNLATDMIWPEIRVINNESVVVPILYLTTSTINGNKVTKTTTEFTGSAASLGSITLDHATLTLGAKTMLATKNGITLGNEALIRSDGDINLSVGGTLNLIGSKITGVKDVNIIAKEIKVKAVVIPFQDRYGSGTKLGSVSDVSSSTGNIFIRSTSGDITFERSTATAYNGSITLDSARDIFIRPVFTSYEGAYKNGDWEVSASSLDVFGSKLTAKDKITLIAKGVIEISASELISTEGGIELLANQGILVVDELTQEQIQKVDRKGKTTGQSSEFRTEAVRSILKAGKGVVLDSEYGDVVLKATEITSTEGTQVTAKNGKVNLLMTKELEERHLQTVRKGTWTIKTRTEDIIHENNIQNAIVGGLQVQAKYGINVEYTGKEGATLKEQIEEYRKIPEMKWMAALYDQSVVAGGQSVNWDVMEEVHKELKKTKRNLSPAAMAIIAIAVAVAMGPMGAQLVGSASGGLSATIAGSVSNATLGAALAAGAVTITTQAVQSLAAGNNLRETLDAMDSTESLKSLAVSMATAGAMQHTDLKIFDAVDGDSLGISFAKQAGQAVVNSTVSAGISTVVYGGNSQQFLSSFKQGLMTSAVNTIGEKMANKIGGAYKDGDINNVVRYVAHAGAGCVMGLGIAGASGSTNDESLSCFSGAGGAVVGELAADAYKVQKLEELANEYKGIAEQLRARNESNAAIEAIFQSPEMQDRMSQQMSQMKAAGVDLAKLSGAFAALAAGGDVSIASQTAENAAKNNALFLIPLAILAIKAIDITLTAKELWEIYDTNKNNPEALSKELGIWLATEAGISAVGLAIPGFKTAAEMTDWLRRNNILSPSTIDGIARAFKGFNNQPPSTDINVTRVAPAPQNPLDLATVGGKSSFIQQINVPNDAIRNDGVLGEQVAEQIIGNSTGLIFRTTLKNNSNNGIDLVAKDDKNKTIWIVEVKSSIRDTYPSVGSQNLVTRSNNWINDAAAGRINGQQLDPAEIKYANEVLDLVNSAGWKIKPMYSTVNIPKPNTVGPVTVTIQPVI